MSSNQVNDRRPTALEERAYAEARQHFAEHLKQFPESRDAIRHLEKNLTSTALAVKMTTSRTAPSRTRIQTNDGASWYKSLDLMDNSCACYRPTAAGTEFAVVEQLPSGDAQEVVTRGRNVVDVLQAFAREQQHALQIWTEDVAAQVREHLAEKYPGHDMSRVADGFMHRFTHPLTLKETLAQTNVQKHSGGIGV